MLIGDKNLSLLDSCSTRVSKILRCSQHQIYSYFIDIVQHKTSCLTWIKNIFFDHSLPQKTQHVNLGFSVFPERQLDIFIIQRCCKTRRESWFSSTYSLASWKERWHTLQYLNIDSLIDKILRFYNKRGNQVPIKLRYSIRNSGEHIQFDG